MAHIKDAYVISYGMVLIVYTGIGNGHIISGKLSHFSAKVQMDLGERSILHKGNKICGKCIEIGGRN